MYTFIYEAFFHWEKNLLSVSNNIPQHRFKKFCFKWRKDELSNFYNMKMFSLFYFFLSLKDTFLKICHVQNNRMRQKAILEYFDCRIASKTKRTFTGGLSFQIYREVSKSSWNQWCTDTKLFRKSDHKHLFFIWPPSVVFQKTRIASFLSIIAKIL